MQEKEKPFHLISAETLDLNLELAQQFNNMEPSPTERELKEERVQGLLAKMKAGLLVTFQWSKAQVGNKQVRMNGQHSSRMLCGLNGAFPSGLKVHLDTYEVPKPEGLATLFRQFDDRKSTRSVNDVAYAYQGVANLRSLNPILAKLAVDGIAWYLRVVEGAPVAKNDDIYSFFNREGYQPFIRWIAETVHKKKTYEFDKEAVIGAMHSTFLANSSEAQTFWKKVSKGGEEYEPNHPTTVLDAWLKSIKDDKELKKGISAANHYQGCIYAWNAYRQEKTIKDIRHDARKGFLDPIE